MEFELTKDQQNAIREISAVKYDPKDYDNPDDVMPTTGAKGSLKLADLAGKGYDDADWEKLLDQMSIEDMTTLINTGGWQTAAIDSAGKVATSDCDGSYGYEITDAAIRAGNDLMLGYGMAESNKPEDTDAATCVLAMRQACKNILYTVANSGY